MEISIYVIALGAVMLMVPQGLWIGIAFLGIGIVIYGLNQKDPSQMPIAPPKSMAAFYPNRQQSAGVAWDIRDIAPGKGNPVARAQNPMGAPEEGPYVKEGMFNLPLPMSEEVSQFVNLKYKTPTKAKGYMEEMQKKGNPWVPDF